MNHDQILKQQVKYLQQCLSSSRRPLGLFLGAGCPMSIHQNGTPLIPDIAGMTKFIREKLSSCENYAPLLEKVQRQLITDDNPNPDVENMLTHIRALRVVVGEEEVHGLSAAQLDQLDDKICQLIHEISDKSLPCTDTPYHHVASWVNASQRESPIEIFTTNYDLLMEQAFEYFRVPYFDGFIGVRKPFFDLRAMEEEKLPPRWARLWKLHGSINWYQRESERIFRGTTNESEDKLKRIIHPSNMKYQESRRMPYLAMIDQLRSFLKNPNATLIICGYSFRDEHINEIIVQGLRYTSTATTFVLLFDELNKYSQASLLASEQLNLSVIAQDGGVISGNNHKWPEQDFESTPVEDCPGIEWERADPTNENNTRHRAKSTFGNFAIFGKFLRELTGNVWQQWEKSNGE